jgi:hypothetical protein
MKIKSVDTAIPRSAMMNITSWFLLGGFWRLDVSPGGAGAAGPSNNSAIEAMACEVEATGKSSEEGPSQTVAKRWKPPSGSVVEVAVK